MQLKTSNGNAYTIDWIDTVATSGNLFMQMGDDRALSVIAAEFDGLAWLKRESDTQGDKMFEGFSVLKAVQRAEPGIVILTIEKGVDANGDAN